MTHLFGLSGFGTTHVVPYCTCGLIFSARTLSHVATTIRAEWVDHLRKVEAGTEERRPYERLGQGTNSAT